MTFENLQSDAPATGRKMVRQALLLTRVSLIAMTTALMPMTLGGLHNPVVSKAAFAQSASDDGTADQGTGDAPSTPTTDSTASDDGTADQGSSDTGDSADNSGDSSGGSDDGATHDVGDDGDGGGSGSGGDSGGEGGGGSGGGGGDD